MQKLRAPKFVCTRVKFVACFCLWGKRRPRMPSNTLTEGLKRYEIGPKLRALRLKKKLGLVQLGRHTGLSPALLSKLERGRLFPTLPTLLRIALVFSVGLDYFFTDAARRPVLAVVRKRDRLSFPERPGVRHISYEFESLNFPVEEPRCSAYFAEFLLPPANTPAPHHHPGIEFLYLIRGRLRLQIGSDETILETGDSIYFDSTVPHSYARTSRQSCEAVVVTTT
jgi:transcriptional regulator with XRE-family HTH domain